MGFSSRPAVTVLVAGSLLFGAVTVASAAGPKSTAVATTAVSVSAPTPAVGTVTATAQATAGRLARLEVYLDNTLQKTCTVSTCKYLWNTLQTPNGNHTLLAKRYDTGGGVQVSSPFTVVVNNDLTPPAVS